MLFCQAFLENKGNQIVKKDILHLSAFRNVQRVQIKLTNGRLVSLFNTHLHHVLVEGPIREHQISHMLYWID